MRQKKNTTVVNTDLENKIAEREEFFQTPAQLFQSFRSLTNEDQIQSVLPQLCQVEFFKKSCPDNLTVPEFVASCVPLLCYEEFEKGKCVFHLGLGEQGDKFYVVLSGRVGILLRKDEQKVLAEEYEAEQILSKLNKRGSTLADDNTPQLDSFEVVMKRLIKRSTKPHHVKEIELALLANALLDQYFTEGYAFRYHQVAVNYAGSSFGDMALTEDKPRTATLLALTDLQLVSMNKEGYQKVFQRQILLTKLKIDFFSRLYPAVARYKLSKYAMFFKELSMPPNAYIWKEGDPTLNFAILIQPRYLQYVYCVQDFNVVRKTYPEIVKSMTEIDMKQKRWQEERVTTVVDFKRMDIFPTVKPTYVERRRVDDIEQQIPRFVEEFRSPTIRSMVLKKVTKDELVLQNQDLFQQLQHTSEERGIEKDFNMLKMANDNIQKSLRIRVVKQYEMFQPTKPKGPTPHFNLTDQTPSSIFESLQQASQLPFKRAKKKEFVSMFKVNSVIQVISMQQFESKDSPTMDFKDDFRQSEYNFSRIINPQLQSKTKSFSRFKRGETTLMHGESLKTITDAANFQTQPIHSKTMGSLPRPLKKPTHPSKTYMSQVEGFVLQNSVNYSTESLIKIQ